MYAACMEGGNAPRMTAALTTTADGDGGSNRAGQTRWDGVLSGIRADMLDCLQSTVAVIADDAHGPDAHLELGRAWRFPARGQDGAMTMQSSLDERLTQARQVLGLRAGTPRGPMQAAGLRELAAAGPLYVVADAYDLGWLPYARATVRGTVMPHSFLLAREGGHYTVVDAYRNDTEWGSACPAAASMTSAELDAAIAGPAQAISIVTGPAPRKADQAAVMAANAAAARAASGAIADYTACARAAVRGPAGVERLALDVWLTCRERQLHAAWLGGHPAAAAVTEAAGHWQQLATHTYVASRRARRGVPPSPALADDIVRRLEADAALAVSLAPAAAIHTPESVADAVTSAIRVTLGVDPAGCDLAAPLRQLPGFSSFRLVEIIDKVESDLGFQFPGDAAPDDLADAAGLCRLFTRAAERAGRLRR